MPAVIDLAQLTLPSGRTLPASEPPPRFRAATFGSYEPGNESQERASHLVREAVEGLAADSRFRWPWRRRPQGRGIYLDGGYGVGKTHLLAAAYHLASHLQRAYLTFPELVHLIGAQGMPAVKERFSGVALLCLDEFELDDPGNTLIVKRFLEAVFADGALVVTTSNTPPEAQGQGRFNAEDFRREIQGIAERFETVPVEGRDYRGRGRPPRLLDGAELQKLAREAGDSPRVLGSMPELMELLRELHPIRYGPLLEEVGTLFITGVHTIPDQNDALRFVHFIDQLYNREVGLRLAGDLDLNELFHVSYRNGAFSRKHERCISRLGELIEEPLDRPAVTNVA